MYRNQYKHTHIFILSYFCVLLREVREDVNTQMCNVPGETSTHMVISGGEVRQTYVPLSPWVLNRQRVGGCLSLFKSSMQEFRYFCGNQYIFTAVTLNLHFRFQGKSITCINWVKTLWLQYWGNRKAEKHVAGQAFIEKKMFSLLIGNSLLTVQMTQNWKCLMPSSDYITVSSSWFQLFWSSHLKSESLSGDRRSCCFIKILLFPLSF